MVQVRVRVRARAGKLRLIAIPEGKHPASAAWGLCRTVDHEKKPLPPMGTTVFLISVNTHGHDSGGGGVSHTGYEKALFIRTAVVSVEQGLGGFASGRATLPPKATPAIAELANELKNNRGRVVVIDGRTDTVGPSNYNHALGMERARAVHVALVRQGIESSRITIRSHGEENPVASNDTSAGRRDNRRVQIRTGGTTESLLGSSSQLGSSQGTATTSSGPGGQAGQSGQNGQSGQ